ncbi:MAG: outer membrane beta-barrel protein, partial [Polyangiaceae bacterium]
NWSYTHAFLADATPYYFFGFRGQAYTSAHMKVELWIVNGWQTFGQWHEGRAGVYLWNWRPGGAVSIVNSVYAGQEAQGDPDSLRVYSDNDVQVRYYHSSGPVLRSMALSLVGDIGYEHRGNAPSGAMGGIALANRVEWTERWKSALRGDFLYDRTQAISPRFPVGAAYPWQGTSPFFAAGVTATLDYWPSPWIVTRLEGSHRIANQPLFSGPGGITGPGGQLPASAAAATFTPDLRHTDDRILFNVTLRL